MCSEMSLCAKLEGLESRFGNRVSHLDPAKTLKIQCLDCEENAEPQQWDYDSDDEDADTDGESNAGEGDDDQSDATSRGGP